MPAAVDAGSAPPPRWRFFTEGPRAALDGLSFLLARDRLRAAPRGDGRPVLLLPGLATGDFSNLAMRRFLRRTGYRAEGWGLGRNRGPRSVGADAERLIARIEALAADSGEKVTLIGVSLGGILARLAAHRRPDLVREVITVSAPYAGSPKATNVWRAYELLAGERITDGRMLKRMREAAAALPVPATAIWSRSDGFVNGWNCHDANGRSIEVASSHIGVQINPRVLLAIAGVLAGKADQ